MPFTPKIYTCEDPATTPTTTFLLNYATVNGGVDPAILLNVNLTANKFITATATIHFGQTSPATKVSLYDNFTFIINKTL